MRKKLLYAYSVPHDSGNAPCVFNNNEKPTKLLTLSCCKGGKFYKNKPNRFGGLRYHIGNLYMQCNNEYDFYILGMYKNEFLYFCRITDVKEMEDYYSQNIYKDRKDFIYTYDMYLSYNKQFGVNYIPHLVRNNNNPLFHPKEIKGSFNKQLVKDLIGKYVLLSDKFVYFGDKSPQIDFLKTYLTKNRTSLYPTCITNYDEIKRNYVKSELIIKKILDWLNKEYNCNLEQPNVFCKKPHIIIN